MTEPKPANDPLLASFDRFLVGSALQPATSGGHVWLDTENRKFKLSTGRIMIELAAKDPAQQAALDHEIEILLDVLGAEARRRGRSTS